MIEVGPSMRRQRKCLWYRWETVELGPVVVWRWEGWGACCWGQGRDGSGISGLCMVAGTGWAERVNSALVLLH